MNTYYLDRICPSCSALLYPTGKKTRDEEEQKCESCNFTRNVPRFKDPYVRYMQETSGTISEDNKKIK